MLVFQKILRTFSMNDLKALYDRRVPSSHSSQFGRFGIIAKYEKRF